MSMDQWVILVSMLGHAGSTLQYTIVHSYMHASFTPYVIYLMKGLIQTVDGPNDWETLGLETKGPVFYIYWFAIHASS